MERGTTFPVTVGSIAQQAYLKASNTGAEDGFGFVVAASGDTIAVGALFEDSATTGVEGDQHNDDAVDSGAVYMYERSGTTWTQRAYLKASNTGAEDFFGSSISLAGDWLAVGAASEDSAATGADGDQGNDDAPDSGAVYVFHRQGTTWVQHAYIKASNTGAGDRFGTAVELSPDGDLLIVGANGEDSAATGIGGDQTDDSAAGSGAVYVLVRRGTVWTYEAYIKASNCGEGDQFGRRLSLDGDTLVVGAAHEDSASTAVDGDQSDDSASSAGAAYVFVRQGSTWSQQAYLKASNTDAGDFFGTSTSISGDTIVVGAQYEDSGSNGINGDEGDDSDTDSGAAYVFRRIGTTWSQEAYVKASNGDSADQFGASVSLLESVMVVGAFGEDSLTRGIDGPQHIPGIYGAGASYLFERQESTWTQVAFVKASNTDARDFFGHQVALADGTLVVGGYGEASASVGVNGDPDDDSVDEAGAVYIYDLDTTDGAIRLACFGDGSSAPCACGNEAPNGIAGGCRNAVSLLESQGALLSASGSASVAADDLLLTAYYTTHQPGLFFCQGSAMLVHLQFGQAGPPRTGWKTGLRHSARQARRAWKNQAGPAGKTGASARPSWSTP